MNADSASNIRITRASEWRNLFRAFKVFIDDNLVGTIKNGATVEYPVSPGIHRVYLEIDWCVTSTVEIDCDLGKEIALMCGSSEWARRFLIPQPIPDAYIQLWVKEDDLEEDEDDEESSY
jgi:hypothetical protein